MRAHKILFVSALLCSIIPFHSFAQPIDNSALMQRLDEMENNVMQLQRQMATGGSGNNSVDYSVGTSAGAAGANAQVQLTGLEEQLRKLQGQIEENNFQVRSLSEKMDKSQADIEYRLNALEHPAIAPAAPAGQPAVAAPAAQATPPAPAPETTYEQSETAPAPAPEPGVLKPPSPPQTDSNGNMSFDNSRDHYNYAFRLLNQTKYDDAAKSFTQFTQKYPNDPLIGNAFYWLGETYYVRQDYMKSADYFRQGFEKSPSSPKAADNLLKLSMALSAVNRNKEACVVLNQLLVKFGNNSKSVKQKTEQEINRIGCK